MFLKQPFPAYTPSPATLKFAFLAGLVVFLILALFKPFRIDSPGNHFTLWHAVIYGTGTFIMVMLNTFILPVLFRKLFAEEKWTAGKEMVMMMWQISSIGFINLIITHYLYRAPVSFDNALKFLLITAAVGIFPVTLIILLKQQALYKRYAARAAVLDEKLDKSVTATGTLPGPVMVQLTSDLQQENILLPLESIRYISAADNYIKVHYIHNGKLSQKVLRSTLKKAQDNVNNYPQLFRCHRTYIVNMAAVCHVSGNAQGYKLHLQDTDERIPVSRSLHDALSTRLNMHSNASR